MRLETDRLVIRTFENRDSSSWVAMFSLPEVRRYIPPGPAPTRETFQNALARRQQMEQERGFAVWAVQLRDSHRFIGQCGLYPAEHTGPEIELAYHYHPDGWGKGYGTEAARSVLDYGLKNLGLEEVIALAMSENVGSWRVMEKSGMRFVGFATYYGLDGLKKYSTRSEKASGTSAKADPDE